ncbi:ATP-binding protein [Streptomyces sp. NPDC004520]|uniref:ATP-binding protein n=1 Tax=Streptomyces sp. NPDC004520 TaxID=3364702 RepID=UPI0036814A9F
MHTITPHQPVTVRTFAQQLSSTRRGARLARLLVMERLTAWEVSLSVADRAERIVAELAANAVRHGRVQGRDFRVALTCASSPGLLRIEVTDPRGERLPALPSDPEGLSYEAESGRGLLLVAALADRWGVEPYPPSGKTVWAEVGPAGPKGVLPSPAPCQEGRIRTRDHEIQPVFERANAFGGAA